MTAQQRISLWVSGEAYVPCAGSARFVGRCVGQLPADALPSGQHASE